MIKGSWKYQHGLLGLTNVKRCTSTGRPGSHYSKGMFLSFNVTDFCYSLNSAHVPLFIHSFIANVYGNYTESMYILVHSLRDVYVKNRYRASHACLSICLDDSTRELLWSPWLPWLPHSPWLPSLLWARLG